MIDTNTGELLACVTYPGYDTNRLANTMDSDYYSYLNQNLSNPLYNHATQAAHGARIHLQDGYPPPRAWRRV